MRFVRIPNIKQRPIAMTANRGVQAVDFLRTEAKGDYAAYAEAVENAYRVGSPVVRELAGHWAQYRGQVPAPKP